MPALLVTFKMQGFDPSIIMHLALQMALELRPDVGRHLPGRAAQRWLAHWGTSWQGRMWLVYLSGVVVISIGQHCLVWVSSVVCASFEARMTHRLSVRVLKRAFSLLLFFIGCYLIIS